MEYEIYHNGITVAQFRDYPLAYLAYQVYISTNDGGYRISKIKPKGFVNEIIKEVKEDVK